MYREVKSLPPGFVWVDENRSRRLKKPKSAAKRRVRSEPPRKLKTATSARAVRTARRKLERNAVAIDRTVRGTPAGRNDSRRTPPPRQNARASVAGRADPKSNWPGNVHAKYPESFSLTPRED